ncbi:MAG: hypothetical protein QF915_03190, partial [Candidatus Woesearchaeota archaeon]|nr:hypothetical protein [Candidatus Woesearchaeota archaeon]
AFHNHYAKMLRFVIEDTEKEITKHKRNRKRRSVKKGRKEIRAMKQYLGFQVYMAGKEYDKAIELWDDNEVFYENKAKWCKFREDTSWVLEFSKKALDLKPNDPHYVFLYGVACYESRKYQDALIYVAKSCKLDEGYHDRAAILMKKIHHDMKMDAKKFSVLNN